MFINFLKIAFRNLSKHKVTSFINLFGLTVGLTSCLLITIYILNEISYDKWNTKADHIYRVARIFKTSDGAKSLELGTVSPPFGHYFPSEFPEIENMTRLFGIGTVPMKYQEKIFSEKNAFFADENVFDMFPVEIVKGNQATALRDPYTVMLSEEVAKKYFGDEDPIDKVIRVNSQADAKVTGIYKSFPSNSHIHPEIMVSFNTLKDSTVYGEKQLRTNWGNNSFFTYLQLPENYDPKTLEQKFPDFLDKHMANEYGGSKPSALTSLYLQKLTDIHLYSHTDAEAEPNGDIKRVYIFSVIALFILLIACINYMNLSTARSTLRAKEIGIRKVVGAGRWELRGQFLSESLLMCLIAAVLALLLTWLAIPWLNKVSGQTLSFEVLFQPNVLLPLVATPFIVGLISGLYPAMYMSSFQPVKTLKGLFKAGGTNISLRKVLVVSQFSIGIVLIITTIIVLQQLHYIHNKTLGYDKEQVVIFPYTFEVGNHYESFRTELLQSRYFKNVARSSRIPTGRLLDNMGASALSGDSLKPVTSDIKYVNCDYEFANTFNISLAAGRFFSKTYGADSTNFVINHAAVRSIGWKSDEDAIGKDFSYGGIRGHVVGVVNDFHFESMHQSIAPMVFLLRPSYRRLAVKLTGNTPTAMEALAQTWRKFFPESPFDYTFLDESFDRLYESEQRQASIFTSFSVIAICIACLGLFGLSTFAVSQRIKEIGVRKVLGASVNGLVLLLAKDFLKLVIIAAMIAFPLAWYVMSKWLAGFEYRVSIHWWVFLLSGLLAVLVAFITIGFHAVKAALANPVVALRSE